MKSETEQSAYVFTLSQVEGIGFRSLLQILKVFPHAESLVGATSQEIADKLGKNLSNVVLHRALGHWERAFSSATEQMLCHLDQNVVPIAITCREYPPLLRLIPDPPPLLFVRGSLEVLSSIDTVAIIGTRDATRRGREVARRVATSFGKMGYVIISGLAKGIDTAGHEGALEGGARTVAVLGTALDQIYPSENRGLADRIASDSGALVTELPLGKKSFRNAFVQRDRIQSGMSLAVVPVQTDITGGTMHTVKFAETHGRLLFCPKPLADEQGLKQYRGILELVQTQRAREFQAEDYTSLHALLQEHKRNLLIDFAAVELQARKDVPKAVTKARRRERKKAPVKRQPALKFPELESDTSAQLTAHLDEIVETVRKLGLDSDPSRFDKAMAYVHEKIFGRRKSKRVAPKQS
ncbi:MAG: DNA-protecting protein DprA [Acidobacteria bacterium]|nr:DNA-protecting protein DprA [Acidobacteriota bacterium]